MQHLLELSDRLRRLKSEGLVDCTEILLAELKASESQEAMLGIYGMLGTELQSQGRFAEAESVIREQISLTPEMPDSWISLALHFLYYTREPDKALPAINVALEKSIAEGHFLRQAHLERIRIALALKAYSIVEESLIQLVNYVPAPGSSDSQLETEFIPQIPKGTVDENLVERYKAKADGEVMRS